MINLDKVRRPTNELSLVGKLVLGHMRAKEIIAQNMLVTMWFSDGITTNLDPTTFHAVRYDEDTMRIHLRAVNNEDFKITFRVDVLMECVIQRDSCEGEQEICCPSCGWHFNMSVYVSDFVGYREVICTRCQIWVGQELGHPSDRPETLML